jgi:hypothetical protein
MLRDKVRNIKVNEAEEISPKLKTGNG